MISWSTEWRGEYYSYDPWLLCLLSVVPICRSNWWPLLRGRVAYFVTACCSIWDIVGEKLCLLCCCLILISVSLQTFFEDNPRDLQVLRHNKALGTARMPETLKNVPDYAGRISCHDNDNNNFRIFLVCWPFCLLSFVYYAGCGDHIFFF